MKKLLYFFVTVFIYTSFFSYAIFYSYSGVSAFSLSDIFKNGASSEIPYCDDDDCGLDKGLEEIKDVDLIETEKSASEYVQDVVKFLLGFLALISVLIIIYSGFVLLTGMGDEEKAKKTKKIIIYALAGLALIFLAYPISDFAFRLFNQ